VREAKSRSEAAAASRPARIAPTSRCRRWCRRSDRPVVQPRGRRSRSTYAMPGRAGSHSDKLAIESSRDEGDLCSTLGAAPSRKQTVATVGPSACRRTARPESGWFDTELRLHRRGGQADLMADESASAPRVLGEQALPPLGRHAMSRSPGCYVRGRHGLGTAADAINRTAASRRGDVVMVMDSLGLWRKGGVSPCCCRR